MQWTESEDSNMKMIQKSDLSRLFAAISAEEKLYIPADNAAGKAEYKVNPSSLYPLEFPFHSDTFATRLSGSL